MARHLQHVRSNVVINDQPKLPTSEQIEYGEIAINYAKDHETMSIKNGNNEIVTFTNDNGIKKLINEKVADVKNGDTSIVDENKVATLPTATTSGYGVVIVDDDFDSGSTNPLQNDVISTRFTEVEKVTAAALNDLNERKVDVTDFENLEEIVSQKVADVKNGDTSIVDENKVATLPTATTSGYGVVIVDDTLNSSSTNVVQNKVITTTIIENEKVTAAALNDLNERKVDVTDFENLEGVVNTKVDDVKINDTSIVTDNIANIPSATTEVYGVVIVDDDFDSGSTNPIQNKVIDSALTEIHEVTSAALNDLEDRKANKSEVIDLIPIATSDIYGITKVDVDLDETSINPVQNNTITRAIYDNEEVTAAALNDLNERKMEDVTINGTSIVNNKVADIPFATTDSYGVAIVDDELDTESTNPIQNGVISSFIERKEIVIAAALNDLNDKVTNLSANTTVRVSNLEAIVGLENAPEFNITTDYSKDDLVIYDGKLYKFNVTHTAGAWNASQVTETSLFSEIQYILKNYQI